MEAKKQAVVDDFIIQKELAIASYDFHEFRVVLIRRLDFEAILQCVLVLQDGTRISWARRTLAWILF